LQKCLRAFFIVEQFSKLFTPRASNASALAWAVKNSVLQQFLFAHFLFQTPILCNRNTKTRSG